jgi:hypothetical protein
VRNDRSAIDNGRLPPAESAWSRFWFTPIAPTGLHCVRVLSGLLFLGWLLAFLGHQGAFFSLNGWIDKATLYKMISQPDLAPVPIGWSILYLAGDSPERLQAVYWGSICVLALFTLGVATRITGVLTWVVVVSFVANPASSYEADYLLAILAFYLMIAYLLTGLRNGNLSITERILGSSGHILFLRPGGARPSCAANFVLRLMQIHLAMILVTSGLHKLQLADWWAGVAFWYPMHPPFQTTAESLRREMPNREATLFFLSLAEYLVLAWQIGFPLFAWRTGWWRVLLLGGAAIGWLGVVLIYRLPLFGPFVFIGCLSFLRPEEWAWLGTHADAVVGRRAAAETVKVAAKV